MTLQPQTEHPHGLEDRDFDEIFTRDKPVIFAFHGYPGIIHRLTYRRHNHDNIHVRGYKEKGTTTTPFDMVVLNNLDRYQLAFDAIQRIPRLADQVQKAGDRYWTMMERHKLYVGEHGDDMPEVRDWRWTLRISSFQPVRDDRSRTSTSHSRAEQRLVVAQIRIVALHRTP